MALVAKVCFDQFSQRPKEKGEKHLYEKHPNFGPWFRNLRKKLQKIDEICSKLALEVAQKTNQTL